MNQELYAFWKYSSGSGSYKNCLGGPVEKLINKDTVKVKNYGGACFYHFIIMPLEEGLAIQEKLDDLSEEFKKKYQNLNKEFEKRHNEILKVPK